MTSCAVFPALRFSTRLDREGTCAPAVPGPNPATELTDRSRSVSTTLSTATETLMQFDLRTTPFSRRGSYFAISRLSNSGVAPDGLYLRTVHGGAKLKEILRITLADSSQPAETIEVGEPKSVTIACEVGRAEVCIDESDRLLFRGELASLSLEALVPGPYDVAIGISDRRWQYICHGSDINLMLSVHEGRLSVDEHWTGDKSDPLTFRIHPDPITHRFLFVLERFGTSQPPELTHIDFEEAAERSDEDFHSWLRNAPTSAPHLEGPRELAAYVTWASMVAPQGHIVRPSMLMSKNWMTSVWAWDHCFNAMALLGDPKAATDQFLCIFDFQDESGGVPDSFNDSAISWNFTKPAIHGWALSWMMKRARFGQDFYAAAYAALEKWTSWWFTFRDYRGAGFPAYNHGNDSGWDNGTVFAKSVPIESPDQLAFLVIQLETLSTLALELGLTREAKAWGERSAGLLDRLLQEFWVDGRFVARHALDGSIVSCDSLLMYVPLVLGERLPPAVFADLVDGLTSGDFLTPFGMATESASSELYERDGYWRGPIWAPPTLLIVDGLSRGGRTALSRDIATRFCDLASRSGMAENYDAFTGDGFRDRAYTWTASTFLILANEYAE